MSRFAVALSMAAIALALVASPAFATSYTWSPPGGSDNQWATSTNWSPNGVPGAGDSASVSGSPIVGTADVTVGSLTVSAGSLTISGGHSLTVSGAFAYDSDSNLNVGVANSGPVDGTLSLNGASTISPPDGLSIGLHSGVLNVNSTLTTTKPITLGGAGSAAKLNIATTGSVTLNPSSGETQIQAVMDDKGTIENKAGTLEIFNGDGGTRETGSYVIDAGTSMQLDSGGNLEAASITGAGTYNSDGNTTVGASDTFTPSTLLLSGNTFTLNKNISIPNVSFLGGERTGTGTLTATAAATFGSGGFNFTGGTTTVASTVTGPVDYPLSTDIKSGSTLNLNTSIDWTGGYLRPGGTGVVNLNAPMTINTNGLQELGDGLFHVGPSGSITDNPGAAGFTQFTSELDNDGSISVQSGKLELVRGDAGTTTGGYSLASGSTLRLDSGTLESPSIAGAGGTVDLASGGFGSPTLTVDPGDVFQPALTMEAGTLKGSGTLSGSVTNTQGSVSPGHSPGKLTIDGDYTQGGNGTLDEDIAGTTAASGFDQLVVHGTVALDGTLAIHSGSFAPALTDNFHVIASGAAPVGTFSTLSGSLATNGRTFTANYVSDGVVLTMNGAPPPPVNVHPPTITGAPTVGHLLTCTNGTWTGNPTNFKYVWFRNGGAIGGATGQTYTVQPGDSGHVLSCSVVASNAGGPSDPARSGQVAVSAGGAVPKNLGLPAISGTALSGHVLSCSRGTWSGNPTSFRFRWLRGGVPISGATGPTYTVAPGDENQFLACAVTAANGAGRGGEARSRGVHVGFSTKHCPVPSGSIGGKSVGPLSLGMTRTHARRILPRFTVQKFKFDDFCLHSRFGIRVKYADSVLLRSVPHRLAAKVRGRVVIALTSCGHYRLEGVKSGNSLAANARRLHVGKRLRVGKNDWYVLPFDAAADGVLKVRGDKVVEVGIADKHFLGTAKARHHFFFDFVKG